MSRRDFGTFLNTLLEAERAGAKLLAAYVADLPPQSTAWTALHKIQRDEAHNCAVLIHLLLNAEIEPSMGVGDFYERGSQVERAARASESRTVVGRQAHRGGPASHSRGGCKD